MSGIEVPAIKTVVSSANRTVLTPCRWPGRQLTKVEKRSGPRTDPWGTQDVIARSSECFESIAVHWHLSSISDWSHWQVTESRTNSRRRDKRRSWFTVSKAFDISRKTTPTDKPLSRALNHSLVTWSSVVVIEWPGLNPDCQWWRRLRLFTWE